MTHTATARAENIAALATADAACVTTSQHPRQQTVFHLCPRHGWLAGESRERRAETFGEGGPTDGPCTPGDSCKIRPGRDLWIAEMCVQRAWYDTATGDHHYRWAVNAVCTRSVRQLGPCQCAEPVEGPHDEPCGSPGDPCVFHARLALVGGDPVATH